MACSSNEDIPEEHVFTPNATLSLATGVYGDGRTKAVGIDVTEEEKKENKIHTLDVLVFSGKNILIIGLRRMLLLPVRNCGGMVTTSKMIGMESIK